MPMVKTTTDLSVLLSDDKPGTLARVLDVVSMVNLEGCAEIEGSLHILAVDAGAARTALLGAGFNPKEAPVVVADVADGPGAAAGMLRRIAGANLNVSFVYLATNNRLVIGTRDAQKAATALR